MYINFKQILPSDDFFLNNSVKLTKEEVCVDLLRLYHAVAIFSLPCHRPCELLSWVVVRLLAFHI